MRNLLLYGFAAATICVGVHQDALAGGAKHAAAPKKTGHTWIAVNAADGVCEPSEIGSPDHFFTILNGPTGHASGFAVDRITPDNVEKDDAGNIHVTVTFTKDGTAMHAEFFTSMQKCQDYLSTEGIAAQAANHDDIN